MEDSTLPIISIVLIIILASITLILMIINFTKNKYPGIEGFMGCYEKLGKISKLNNTCGPYNNMTNNGRLSGNRGPISGFHQCFTNGEIPELKWRKYVEAQMANTENVHGLNGEMIQYNDNAVNNVYSTVNY